ncbi:MAG: hypothetical protein Q9224_001182 [Gallowayella concinna]
MRQRDQNYEDPGKKGRATGISVGDLGPRDEHGFEPINNLFSSPEKSPPKRNGVSRNSTVVEQDEDETMNIGSSTIPEPTEVIKARNGKSILPPPKSRSPIKTSLGSAARRSLGARSSPSRGVEHDTPTHRALTHPPNRRLDFSMTDSNPSVNSSATKAKLPAMRAPKLKPTPMASSSKRKRSPFDLPPDQDEEPFEGENNLVNGTSLEEVYDDNQNISADALEDSFQLPNGNDVSQIQDDQLQQDQDTISPSIEKDKTTLPAKKNGKRGKTAASKLAQAEDQVETTNPTPSPARRGRGRPPKKPKLDVPVEEPAGELSEPSKKSNRAQPVAMQPPKTKGAHGRQALTLGDPNTKLRPRRRASRSVSKGPLSPSKTRFVTRSETPGDELSFRTTRTGRNVLKPLAFWRGESAVFSPGRLEDGNRVLPSIKEVIRTEEVAEPLRKKTFGQPRKRRRPARRPEEDDLPERDDDEEEEYWETEAGVIRASVMLWDPTTGRGDEESVEEAGKSYQLYVRIQQPTNGAKDVAYAAEAIEMRDISGADFRFAKTLTLPFFGSGMVDLPPGGTKRVKNSRKMQMVFFVFYGRVTVELGTPTERFSIGRGGMWQVPRETRTFFGSYTPERRLRSPFLTSRVQDGCKSVHTSKRLADNLTFSTGNFYSITNNAAKPARIFFAQGCEVAPESPGLDESGAA